MPNKYKSKRSGKVVEAYFYDPAPEKEEVFGVKAWPDGNFTPFNGSLGYLESATGIKTHVWRGGVILLEEDGIKRYMNEESFDRNYEQINNQVRQATKSKSKAKTSREQVGQQTEQQPDTGADDKATQTQVDTDTTDKGEQNE